MSQLHFSWPWTLRLCGTHSQHQVSQANLYLSCLWPGMLKPLASFEKKVLENGGREIFESE